MGYSESTRRMQVRSLHPGIRFEQVQAATGFQLESVEKPATTEAPTEAELTILREQVDPHRYILGRGNSGLRLAWRGPSSIIGN